MKRSLVALVRGTLAARLRPAGGCVALVAVTVGCVALVAVTVGCAPGTASGGGPENGRAAHRTALTVLAAASLTEVFTELGQQFERANPGIRISFSFASSTTLAAQIVEGAPADVYAAADPANLRTVTRAGQAAGEPVTFARNQLVIAVRRGNPRRITGLADLARPGVTVALCARQVPCGAAAATALDAAGVTLVPATAEPTVKAALMKVRLGEVDAALVYRTDVTAPAGEVTAVEFPETGSATVSYSLVVLKAAANPSGATAFIAHLRSESGRSALAAAGFLAP